MRPDYIPREVYLTDGITTAFTFDFKIVNKEHLLVLLVDDTTGLVIWQTRGTDTTYFNTTLNPDGSGGTITIAPALLTGSRLLLLLADDFPTQPSRWTIDDRYDLKKFESSLDTLSGQIQRIRYLVDRSFKMPESFTAAFPSELTGEVLTDSVLVMEYDIDDDSWYLRTVPRTDFVGPQGEIGLSPIIGIDPDTVDVDYEDDAEVFVDNTNPLNPILSFTLRAGPQGPIGNSTVLVTANDQLPDNGVGSDGDMWFTLNDALPEHGNVYQRAGGVYVLKGNIQGPPGGVNSVDGEQGDLLFSWVGYSGRFSQAVNLPTLRDAVDYLIDLAYLVPLINSFTSNNTLREKGATVTNPTLTVNAAKRTDDLNVVKFYDQSTSTLLDTQVANDPAAIVQSLVTALSFTDNKIFRVEVEDVHTPTGMASTTLTFPFVHATYRGAGANALSAASVAGLTKEIVNNSNTKNVVFTLLAGQKPYMAIPASYGAFTSILDENGFESIGSWTRRDENITNTYGVVAAYYIYEFNNLAGVDNTTNYTFKR